MGRKCCVPGCKSGYNSNAERVSLFGVPKDDVLREKWVSVIPATRIPITSAHSICEKHFLASDVERKYIAQDKNGKIIADVDYLHPRLKKSAIPCIFQLAPKYNLHKYISTDQSSPTIQSMPNIGSANRDTVVVATSKSPIEETDPALPALSEKSSVSKSVIVNCDECVCKMEDLGSVTDPLHSDSNRACHEYNICQPEIRVEPISSLKEIFIYMYNSANAVNIPPGWLRYTSSSGEKWVAFSSFEKKTEQNFVQLLPRKSVLVLECGKVYASANGKSIPTTKICRSLQSIHSVEHLSRLLSTFASVGLCSGIQLVDDSFSQFRMLHQDHFGQWRPKNCSVLSNDRTCTVCQKLKRTITQRNRRLIHESRPKRIVVACRNLQEKSKIIALRKRLRSQKEAIRRARQRAEKN